MKTKHIPWLASLAVCTWLAGCGHGGQSSLGGLEGEGELLERAQIPLPDFAAALARLNTLKYRYKARIIEACVTAVAADGKVTLIEAELLRAIGARLDCPIPPILPGNLD